MNASPNQNKVNSVMQAAANKHQKKIYVYQLKDGNRISSLEPILRSEKINGSQIDKLIDIVKPEKS